MRYHPEFVKFRFNLIQISFLRGGILVFISLIIYLMGSRLFSVGMMTLSIIYLMVDLFLTKETISEVSHAHESTQYLICKNPEELIAKKEGITDLLLEDRK
jgi:hypothetical protein